MQYTGKIKQILSKLKFTIFDEEKIYDLEIKEHREKRSRNANNYAWLLLGKLAKKINIPDVEIYCTYVRELGFYQDLKMNDITYKTFKKGWEHNGIAWMCEKVDTDMYRAYYGSSIYDTSKMSKLIENIVNDCKIQGIETLEDKKLKQLLDDWERNKK